MALFALNVSKNVLLLNVYAVCVQFLFISVLFYIFLQSVGIGNLYALKNYAVIILIIFTLYLFFLFNRLLTDVNSIWKTMQFYSFFLAYQITNRLEFLKQELVFLTV